MQLSTVLESALYHQHVLNVSKVKALIVLKIGPTDWYGIHVYLYSEAIR